MKNLKIKAIIGIVLCLSVLLCACGSTKTASAADSEAAAVLTELDGLNFSFLSGAGGWCTELHISADGSFSGNYHDSEMGDMTAEYPNGTVYTCSFSGRLEGYTAIDENSFSFTVAGLEYPTVGEESVTDEIRYVNAEPYGISDGCTLTFFRAGSSIENIPEDMRFWLWAPGYMAQEDTAIPGMVFMSTADESVFISDVIA